MREVELQGERIGQARLVVRACHFGHDGASARVGRCFDDVHGDLVTDDFLVQPTPDGALADVLALLIADERVLGEGYHHPIAIVHVHRLHEGKDGLRKRELHLDHPQRCDALSTEREVPIELKGLGDAVRFVIAVDRDREDRSPVALFDVNRVYSYVGSQIEGVVPFTDLRASMVFAPRGWQPALAINRIRNYYKQLAGPHANLFMLSGHDDARGVFANIGLSPEGRKQYFSFASVVAIINSVVGGSAVAIALSSLADAPLALAACVGGATVVCSLLLLLRFAARLLEERGGRLQALFPSPPSSG